MVTDKLKKAFKEFQESRAMASKARSIRKKKVQKVFLKELEKEELKVAKKRAQEKVRFRSKRRPFFQNMWFDTGFNSSLLRSASSKSSKKKKDRDPFDMGGLFG